MRLVEQFRAEVARRGVPMPGELVEVGVFGDIIWSPCGDASYVMSRVTEDPAFTITGYTRYVALAWIIDEIRFFAARIEPGTPAWWWSGERPEQVAAINAEPEMYEMAIFDSVGDAVTFTAAYLGGMPLREIDVARTRPSPERYVGRP